MESVSLLVNINNTVPHSHWLKEAPKLRKVVASH